MRPAGSEAGMRPACSEAGTRPACSEVGTRPAGSEAVVLGDKPVVGGLQLTRTAARRRLHGSSDGA